MSNAKENKNEDAIQTLEKIGVPPYPVNSVRTLLDAVTADEQFRDGLRENMLRFGPPLHAMAADERGGPGWVTKMRPVIEGWLKEMERGDPYNLVSKTTAKQPRMQKVTA